MEVVIDHLSQRYQQRDEIIDVLRTGDEPFHRLGRLRTEDLPVCINLCETALTTVYDKTAAAIPFETGGVLVGCEVDGRITISNAIEIPDCDASSDRYGLPAGAATAAIDLARSADPRVGYVGEWHSHPRPSPPSVTDEATMLDIAQNPELASPVLLIVTPGEDELPVQAFVTTPAGLKPAHVTMCGNLPDPQGISA